MSKTKGRSDLGVVSISDQLPFRKCPILGCVTFFSSATSLRGRVVLEPLQCKYGKPTPGIAPRAPVLRAHPDPEWPGPACRPPLEAFAVERRPLYRADFPDCASAAGVSALPISPPRLHFLPRRLTFCRKYSLLAADKAGNANLSHLTSGLAPVMSRRALTGRDVSGELLVAPVCAQRCLKCDSSLWEFFFYSFHYRPNAPNFMPFVLRVQTHVDEGKQTSRLHRVNFLCVLFLYF